MVKKVPNFDAKLKEKIRKGLDRAAITLQNGIKKQLSTNPSPSRPGKSPGVKTGALRRSIQVDRTKINELSVGVGSNLKYARIHEYGGVITPVRAKALKFPVADGTWVITQKVNMPARPYLRPALKKNRKKIIAEFQKGMAN